MRMLATVHEKEGWTFFMRLLRGPADLETDIPSDSTDMIILEPEDDKLERCD
jgi:hypothetical protein